MSLLNNTVHIKNSRAEVISLKPMDKLSLDNSMFNILTILFGSFLIAVLAQMRIHLPFSPVPITGQTVGVLLVGACWVPVWEPCPFVLISWRGLLGFQCLPDSREV